MMFSTTTKLANRSASWTRWMSGSSSLVTTKESAAPGVATVTMHRAPVNSLSLPMFQALSESLQELNANNSVHTIVLQSDLPHVFSAGLDLTEMILNEDGTGEIDQLHAFWSSFQQLYLDLYGSPKTTVAALEGSAPAAGCMLALSCDYRIQKLQDPDNNSNKSRPPPYVIGLNESRFGIGAPPFLAQLMVDTVSSRKVAEQSLWQGTLYSSDQALAVGLLDELHADPRQRAIDLATGDWATIPLAARTAGKRLVRGERLDAFVQERQADWERFRDVMTQPVVQAGLRAYLKKLSSSKKST